MIMAWILADIKSIFPLAQTRVSSVPERGDPAPSFKANPATDGRNSSSLEYPLPSDKPSVLVFVRHLGCPFCQESVTLTVHVLNEDAAAHDRPPGPFRSN